MTSVAPVKTARFQVLDGSSSKESSSEEQAKTCSSKTKKERSSTPSRVSTHKLHEAGDPKAVPMDPLAFSLMYLQQQKLKQREEEEEVPAALSRKIATTNRFGVLSVKDDDKDQRVLPMKTITKSSTTSSLSQHKLNAVVEPDITLQVDPLAFSFKQQQEAKQLALPFCVPTNRFGVLQTPVSPVEQKAEPVVKKPPASNKTLPLFAAAATVDKLAVDSERKVHVDPIIPQLSVALNKNDKACLFKAKTNRFGVLDLEESTQAVESTRKNKSLVVDKPFAAQQVDALRLVDSPERMDPLALNIRVQQQEPQTRAVVVAACDDDGDDEDLEEKKMDDESVSMKGTNVVAGLKQENVAAMSPSEEPQHVAAAPSHTIDEEKKDSFCDDMVKDGENEAETKASPVSVKKAQPTDSNTEEEEMIPAPKQTQQPLAPKEKTPTLVPTPQPPRVQANVPERASYASMAKKPLSAVQATRAAKVAPKPVAKPKCSPEDKIDSKSLLPKPSTSATTDLLSKNDSKLLVLVSRQSLDRQVTANQERVLTILQSHGVDFEIVDGADQSNKDRRNKLFGLSALRGKYPQFFKVQGRETTFWGDWERFECANESGKLVSELGVRCVERESLVPAKTASVAPKKSSFFEAKENNPVVAASVPKEWSKVSAETLASVDRKLLVLISRQSFDRQVAANQDHAFMILDSNGVAYETLDGADVINKDRRNELFAISGLRGKYPQFFLEKGGETTFWGDWSRFEECNDSGSLVLEFGGKATKPASVTRSVNEPVDMTVKGGLNPSQRSILVLCSNQSLKREVVANQDRALTILASKNIPFQTIDGADPVNKDRRNGLFAESGLRGAYPQFFVLENGKTTFWGDFERFEMSNEAGALVNDLLGRMTKARAADATIASSTKSKPKHATKEPTAGSEASKPVDSEAASSSKTDKKKSEPEKQTTKGEADSTKSSTGSNVASKVDSSTSTTGGESSDGSDITIFGSTSFVAQHALSYLRQVSLDLDRDLKVTLAGRNPTKISVLKESCIQKMTHLSTMNPEATSKCVFDVVIAESSDLDSLMAMASRTAVVLNCAGPFAKYSTDVVKACAVTGTDYVDITGEIRWASEMREKFGDLAAKSGARIIPLCGFDSIPSDIAVFAAVRALQHELNRKEVEVARATTWHSNLGGLNGGTIHTVLDMPVDLDRLLHRVPYLLEDPLVLAHPDIRKEATMEATRNRLALAEWINQLPSCDKELGYGFSIPFFMAPVNAKAVQASSIALGYGSSFVYRERFVPAGFKLTKHSRFLSLIPGLLVQLLTLLLVLVLKTPGLGKKLADLVFPPGSGPSERVCKDGYVEVYALVETPVNELGLSDKAHCFLKFEGDPGNYATAQCVCEAALTLIFEKKALPPRSKDGFGTPAELLGVPLLERLHNSTIRPVVVETLVRKAVLGRDNQIYASSTH